MGCFSHDGACFGSRWFGVCGVVGPLLNPPRRGRRRRRALRAQRHWKMTGILPILACHSLGPVWCTDVPAESTATVTGMSSTVNS